MGYLSNRVDEASLQPGDHIYSWRSGYAYAHHGIYIGESRVIHFTRGRDQEIGTNTFLDTIISSSGPAPSTATCEICGNEPNSHGVIKSCLSCFLAGCPLYRFEYSTSLATFFVKIRGGTCSLAIADDPELVLHRANYLLENGFGCYHIFRNNCEDYAIYCKTGLLVKDRTAIGRSGQAISFIGPPVAAILSSPFRFLMSSPWGFALSTVGVYYASKYAADVGIRNDVVKVAVEDLAINVDVGLER
ncbi:hypothetical protein SELMODRAFT_145599 [Selaginella moellendorffii]|uniref:LRAT domain-containing protein n=1 Tax=Selaginella moellendorffii TaxID=88036 RepID=D8RBH1_SELML|nr:uncharacterized protein LOC9650333 [Selaginella moellendorffii]XP_024536754.1 uncharacterized protein LOC9645832 [Selaginella moellendorffii]XP_024536755.1 uncharacterized protein LOC9645832 [Selaginella moellendorffii]EFJ23045.1 hypothetical protein SELMODRAFT_267933 [Selaginella moellendorffii]EFJ30494.1 hypothetical protein SELMODRAFT_145599 [Selaginella moellendorffii]|eukprot:XP_024529027.1 uncharacterized protein LOC9650333 [Selaginella moellendorffii]